MLCVRKVQTGRCRFMTELKKQRLQRNLTQREAAKRIGVSLRTYVTYENDAQKERTAKYRFFLSEILGAGLVAAGKLVVAVIQVLWQFHLKAPALQQFYCRKQFVGRYLAGGSGYRHPVALFQVLGSTHRLVVFLLLQAAFPSCKHPFLTCHPPFYCAASSAITQQPPQYGLPFFTNIIKICLFQKKYIILHSKKK